MPKAKKHTAVYLRVSTDDQTERSQRREIQAWLDNHGIADAVWYFDRHTRDNLNRPEFKKMQQQILKGHVHTVIVWKLDRLSGNMRDGINTIGDWCDRGLRFISTTQGFDFSGIIGQMVAALLFGIAQMEQQTRRERQAAGIKAAQAAGKTWGGSKKGERKKVTPEILKTIKMLLSEKTKIAKIARTVKLSRQTVYTVMKEHGLSS